jgi:hypothetical protein
MVNYSDFGQGHTFIYQAIAFTGRLQQFFYTNSAGTGQLYH